MKWQPTPVLLPGKFHGLRSLVSYRPWGREELDTTEQLHFHCFLLPLICTCYIYPATCTTHHSFYRQITDTSTGQTRNNPGIAPALMCLLTKSAVHERYKWVNACSLIKGTIGLNIRYRRRQRDKGSTFFSFFFFFLVALGLQCCVQPFSSCSALTSYFVASLVAEHRLSMQGLQQLQHVGSIVAHGF